MQVQEQAAHPSTNAPFNQKASNDNTPSANGANSSKVTANKPEIFHLFDCSACARLFSKITNKGDDVIIEHSNGWWVGQNVPENATCYLWPLEDEAGDEWVKEVAATTKAILKQPRTPEGAYSDVYRWMYFGATADDIQQAMIDSEAVPNTDEPTTYDLLVEIKKKADALTADEHRAELRKMRVAGFAATVKHANDDEIIDRLADCSKVFYEQLREDYAVRLGLKPSQLDRLVKESRTTEPDEFSEQRSHNDTTTPADQREEKVDSNLQGSAVLFPNVAPWPEPVDGSAVLGEIAERFPYYLALPEGAADALTLWCVHTHCFKIFKVSPRLNITSPDRGCGKTT
jgi:hypothetical protein